tara:strand:+ start:557 stop:1192 length:636 start_codon:yes stop_codon:yes gene_type:complete
MAFATIDVTKGITGTIAEANLPTIPVTKGGTGLTSGTTNQFLKFTGSTTVASAAVSAGITVADNWRITSSVTGTNSPLTSNWERVDTNGMGTIGSAMTQSSGVFSFPSTGIYQVSFTGYLEGSDQQRYHTIQIYATTDNSSYYHMTESSKYMNYTSNTAYSGVHCSTYFDVTDTAQCKIRFNYVPAANNTSLLGATNYNATHVMFIRMGDT